VKGQDEPGRAAHEFTCAKLQAAGAALEEFDHMLDLYFV
jgi:hypothetical protein